MTKQEYNYLAENLENPRTPLFHDLPKMHKTFYSFPPLGPTVFAFNSCICNLSKFVDSFLKNVNLILQFVIFNPLSYCFEETIGFDVKASFASRPESRLIR